MEQGFNHSQMALKEGEAILEDTKTAQKKPLLAYSTYRSHEVQLES